MLWFVTDSERPAGATRDVIAALAALPNVVILLRDKRASWDRQLLADIVRRTRRVVLNVGLESAARAVEHGILGWHAPEALWRSTERSVTEPPSGLVSVADHDGKGIDFAARHAVPVALVSPIWIDKGRAARTPAAFAAPSQGVLRVALGGVLSVERAELARAAGADGVAVQRALYTATDPAELARALTAPFAGVSGLERLPTVV